MTRTITISRLRTLLHNKRVRALLAALLGCAAYLVCLYVPEPWQKICLIAAKLGLF